jgi:hypothetical protein
MFSKGEVRDKVASLQDGAVEHQKPFGVGGCSPEERSATSHGRARRSPQPPHGRTTWTRNEPQNPWSITGTAISV